MKKVLASHFAVAGILAMAGARAGELPPPGTLNPQCFATADQAADAAMRETYALGDDLLFSGTVQYTSDGCYRYSLPVAQVQEGHMYFPPGTAGRMVAVYFTTREALTPALRRAQQKIADGLRLQVYMGLASSQVTETTNPSES